MRFKPRKVIQAAVLIVGLILYINFFLLAKGYVSIGQQSAHDLNALSDLHSLDGLEDPATGKQNVYPNAEHYEDDRILPQLRFVPDIVQRQREGGQDVQIKSILLFNGLAGWAVKSGQATFLEQKCAVPHCSISTDKAELKTADVVMFNTMARDKPAPHQRFLLYLLESPYHTPTFRADSQFNWTATYRHDSTIVAPYEKFVPYNSNVLTKVQNKNFAEGKTKKVAWFVSNCGAKNNRGQYAQELKKHIQVDIYGRCGTLQCPRHQSSKCFDMLNNDYKFYLAFENSNCRDYITEKFFVNGLGHDVVPIVMGAAPEDYKRSAPLHSFIHVDDFESPKALAEYLNKLDQNDDLYNEYFRWKGTGDIINTFYWCRLCALAHDTDRQPSWYEDVNAWWRGENVCIGTRSWRQVANRTKLIANLPLELSFY